MHDQGEPMSDFPPTEDSISRLHSSGWSKGETAWHAIGDGILYQVDGSNGENRIRVEGATSREA
jgi:hypothetical protein